MPYTIYLRRNTINGMCYIGQTQKTIDERWDGGHGYIAYRGSLLGKAIQEYGKDVFEHIVLCVVETAQEADEAERKYIHEYNSLEPNGYNTTTGGQKGYQASERYKNKITSSSPHKPKSEAFKKAMSERMKAKWQDPTYREITSNRLRENSKQIAENKEQYFTEERRARQSAMGKALWSNASQEKKERMLSGIKKGGDVDGKND